MRIDPQKLLSSCVEAFCVGVAFAVGAAIVVSVLFGLLAFFAGDAEAAEVQIPRAPAPGDAHSGGPRRVGIECPGIHLRRPNPYGIVVAE